MRSTKARRAAQRRSKDQRILRMNADSRPPLYHYDPWGRPCGLGTWAAWWESEGPERRLAQTYLPNGYRVSTIWLGLDHAFGRGRPLIFETGVFRPDGNRLRGMVDMDRYATRREAHAGHKAMVEKWAGKPKLEVVSE